MDFNNICNKDIDIEFLETKIEIERSLNDFLTEAEILSLNIFTEAEAPAVDNQKENGFIAFIKRISEAIVNALKNLGTAIATTFGGGERMDTKDFLNSDIGKTLYNTDIHKINEECDAKILQGRKMVQAISNGTGVDDKTIANYVDGAANFLSHTGPVLLSTGIAVAAIPKAREWINKKLGLIQDSGETLRSVAMKEYADEHKKKEDETKLSKIFSAMGTYTSKFQAEAKKYYGVMLKYKNKGENNKDKNKGKSK